jgi:hypothetical protein
MATDTDIRILCNSGHRVHTTRYVPIKTESDLVDKAEAGLPPDLRNTVSGNGPLDFAHSLHLAVPRNKDLVTLEHVATAFPKQGKPLSLVSTAAKKPISPREARELALELHGASKPKTPVPVVAYYNPDISLIMDPDGQVQEKRDLEKDFRERFGRDDDRVILQLPDYFAADHIVDKIYCALEGSQLRDALRISVSNSGDEVITTLMPNVRLKKYPDMIGEYINLDEAIVAHSKTDIRGLCRQEPVLQYVDSLDDTTLAHSFEEELRDANNSLVKSIYIAHLANLIGDNVDRLIKEGDQTLNNVGLISIETEGVLAGILKDEDNREAIVQKLKEKGLPNETTQRILFNGILLGAPFVFVNEHKV